jgi:hypothetical protein
MTLPRQFVAFGREIAIAAFLLGGTALAWGQSNRVPVPDVELTPVNLCAGGTTRLVNATRELTLPGERYCLDPEWRVRNVERDNRNLYWEVPFSNGVVRCSCRRR